MGHQDKEMKVKHHLEMTWVCVLLTMHVYIHHVVVLPAIFLMFLVLQLHSSNIQHSQLSAFYMLM